MPCPSRMSLRALRRGREEHLGRARVRVLLEEVVLDLPRVVDADRVGVLDLLERVLDQLVLGIRLPGPRQLVLVEDAELHATCSDPSAWNPSRMAARRGLPASACSTSAIACRTKLRAVGAERLRERRVPQRADHFAPGNLRAGLAHERAVAHLGERGAQVVDVRRLVGADVAHELGRGAVAGDEIVVGEHRLGPRERVERRHLDEEQPDHAPQHHLERQIDVGEDGAAPPLRRAPARASAVCRRPERCPCARASSVSCRR